MRLSKERRALRRAWGRGEEEGGRFSSVGALKYPVPRLPVLALVF
jgi:hypothetical protein